MIKKFGLTLGGLQQKIINVVLLFVLVTVGLYLATAAYQSRNLSRIAHEAVREEQLAIAEVSDQTMETVLRDALVRSAAMQGETVNNLFADVRKEVLTLSCAVQELYSHADERKGKPWQYPDPALDGTPSVQFLHTPDSDPEESATPGLLAELGNQMLTMYRLSDAIDGCYIGTADGMLLYVNDRSGQYVQEDGTVMETIDLFSRPWYQGAAEQGSLYFTGVVQDAATNTPTVTCAAPVYIDGELAAVVGVDVFLDSIAEKVMDSAKDSGFICVINEHGQVIFSPQTEGTFRAALSEDAADLRQNENQALSEFIRAALTSATDLQAVTVDGTNYYLAGVPVEQSGWAVVSVVEQEVTRQPLEQMLAQHSAIQEQAASRFRQGVHATSRMQLVVTVLLLLTAILAAGFVANRIVKPVEHMTKQISSVNSSDLDFQMEKLYQTNDEVEVLARAFADLSGRMKGYVQEITDITKEKERIGAELDLARRIQANMLPNIFPPFPERQEFDIFATMHPAKEVGGDFYDFFLIDSDHLGIVMADVSGKSVPAALFMMIAKILLKNFAMLGGTPAKVLEQTNAALVKNNSERMFVTVWFGILEISTGTVKASNAGHEYPVIRQPGGQFSLLKDQHGFVVGSLDGMVYQDYAFHLEPGGALFLYTDGVAEAVSEAQEMFGTDRMLTALNREPDAAPERLLENLHREMNAFVGNAPQFDDITMLALIRRNPEAGDAETV